MHIKVYVFSYFNNWYQLSCYSNIPMRELSIDTKIVQWNKHAKGHILVSPYRGTGHMMLQVVLHGGAWGTKRVMRFTKVHDSIEEVNLTCHF